MFLIPVIVGILVVLVAFIVLTNILQKKAPSKPAASKNNSNPSKPAPTNTNKKRLPNRDHILRTADRYLKDNPDSPEGLSLIADLAWQEGDLARAYSIYEKLAAMPPSSHNLDSYQIIQRGGIAAFKIGRLEAAQKLLGSAAAINLTDYDVAYCLAMTYYQQGNLSAALVYFNRCKTVRENDPVALRYIGLCYAKLKQPKEAIEYLRKAAELAPNDKETMYAMGECYLESGSTEQAIRIFSMLKSDPLVGAAASLQAGMIALSQHQTDAAIEDFTIGLRQEKISQDTLLELKYRLANAFFSKGDVTRGLPLLKEIKLLNLSYKDVPALLSKYQEITSSKAMQTYQVGSSTEFLNLCRRIASSYFPKAKAKIINAESSKDYSEVYVEIETSKWTDQVLFRFYRSIPISETAIQDFASQMKDKKAGRGVCCSPAGFSDGAKRYVEARVIDMVEKEQLNSILNAL